MAYIRRELFTKDKEIQKYVDRLMTNHSVRVPPNISFELSRFKTIQNLRSLDRKDPYVLIAQDKRSGKSIIDIREPLKIKKIGDKYYFSL